MERPQESIWQVIDQIDQAHTLLSRSDMTLDDYSTISEKLIEVKMMLRNYIINGIVEVPHGWDSK